MLQQAKSSLRKVLRNTTLLDLYDRSAARRLIAAWETAGSPVPPPEPIKRRVLRHFAEAFHLRTLIETGTFRGDTVYALKDLFPTIYSIELSGTLWQKAHQRFRRFPSIHILHGDSAELLPVVLKGMTSPCLFWLDGHFSAGVTARAALDTPIVEELQTIFAHPIKSHVILIDDARLFIGADDYPTLAALRQLVAEARPDYQFSVKNDIIRIHPPGTIPGDL